MANNSASTNPFKSEYTNPYKSEYTTDSSSWLRKDPSEIRIFTCHFCGCVVGDEFRHEKWHLKEKSPSSGLEKELDRLDELATEVFDKYTELAALIRSDSLHSRIDSVLEEVVGDKLDKVVGKADREVEAILIKLTEYMERIAGIKHAFKEFGQR